MDINCPVVLVLCLPKLVNGSWLWRIIWGILANQKQTNTFHMNNEHILTTFRSSIFSLALGLTYFFSILTYQWSNLRTNTSFILGTWSPLQKVYYYLKPNFPSLLFHFQTNSVKKYIFIVLTTNNGHLVRWLQTKTYTDIAIDRIRGTEL